MKGGAADFLSKPFKPDVAVMTVQRVLELARLRQENAVLKGGALRASGLQVSKYELEDINRAGRAMAPGGGRKGGKEPQASDYERGLADGEKRAREQFGLQAERQHALLAQVVKQIEQASVGLLGKVEEQVAGLAFEIARKVIQQVAEERRDLVLSQVQQAVSRVRDSARTGGVVRVRVHPTDLPFLEAARDTIATNFEGPVSLTVESDAGIGPGGCRVETETRLVDATLEAQLVRLGEALKRREPRGGA
jgi:flagellar biosynthesis/type III secretory pathway protein FliH